VSRASALAFAAGFAVLAVLVAAGDLASIDRWAMTHAMPDAHFNSGKPTLVDALVPLWGSTWHTAVSVVTNVVTVPAAFLVASAIVLAACLVLGNRGAFLLAAYVGGNVVEEITKATLARPALYAHGVHVAAFDNSFPSGHALRSVLVAAAVAAAWPRVAVPAVMWACCSVAMIEIGALHVPSDIVGGLLLAGGLLATSWSTSHDGTWTVRRPSSASRPSSPAP
jgi:membrane-associated phospholipid phosphatase